MHAHIYINGSSLMMSDAYPEHGHPLKEPTAFNLMLPVQDVDFWFERAIKAGCTTVMAPADMFWGDRCASVADPFGYLWSFATRQKELTAEEMRRAGEEFARKMQQPHA